MKIVHVETGMNLYGGALQVLYLLRGLKDISETENILVCPPGSDIASPASDAARVRGVPMRGDLDIPFLLRLTRIIRDEKPDIVHLHSRRGADLFGGVASRLTGTRCLLTRRVDNPEPRSLVMAKYRLYDRIITISQGILEVLEKEGVPGEKLTCVHSAVDTEKYALPPDPERFRAEFNIPEGTRTCGTVAQFIPRKGHRFLLRAVPEIFKARPETIFLFFGKGPLENLLKQECSTAGISDRVIFTGFREDLHLILPCLNILVHPALMEGLGVSLLQAAAAGVPIIGTRVGGIPEAVTDGVNGLLVPPEDSPAITRAVLRLLGDSALAMRMGSEGRRIAKERFSIEAMVKGNLEVYREMMEDKTVEN